MNSDTVPRESAELLRRIQVLNRKRQSGIHSTRVALYCATVLHLLEKDATSLSVVFAGAREMRRINNAYLGHDYATDVLSFSYSKVRIDGYAFLGEILIAPEIAAVNAARYRISPEREIRKLLVHGILHLLGYDHERDRGRMVRLQTKLLRKVVLARFSLLEERKKAR